MNTVQALTVAVPVFALTKAVIWPVVWLYVTILAVNVFVVSAEVSRAISCFPTCNAGYGEVKVIVTTEVPVTTALRSTDPVAAKCVLIEVEVVLCVGLYAFFNPRG